MFKVHVGCLIAALTLCACKKEEAAKPGAGTGAAKPVVADAAVAAAKPVAADAGASAVGADAAAPAAPGAVHATLEAFCEQRAKSFVVEDCETPAEPELCSCAPADERIGVRTAKGAGAVQEAAIVEIAADAADFVKCHVAVKREAGWSVSAAGFDCGAAPASHDGGISVDVTAFAVTADQVRLAWTESDIQGKPRPRKLEMTCTLGDGAPTCTPPPPRP